MHERGVNMGDLEKSLDIVCEHLAKAYREMQRTEEIVLDGKNLGNNVISNIVIGEKLISKAVDRIFDAREYLTENE